MAGALDDPAGEMRQAALKALVGWKGQAAPAAAALAGVIRDRDQAEADLALQALTLIAGAGAEAVGVLDEVLASGTEPRRTSAAAALAAIGRPAVPALVKRVAAADKDADARFIDVLRAMRAAAQDAVPLLIPVLKDRSWTRVAAALLAIDARQEAAVVAALLARLPQPASFDACTQALAGLAVRTKDETTRQAVVAGLVKEFGAHPGGDGLSKTDRNRRPKAALLRALAEIGPGARAAMPVLKAALADPDLAEEVTAAWSKVVPDEALPAPKTDGEIEPGS